MINFIPESGEIGASSSNEMREETIERAWQIGGPSAVRRRARQLPRGVAAGLRRQLLPAAAQLVSLGRRPRAGIFVLARLRACCSGSPGRTSSVITTLAHRDPEIGGLGAAPPRRLPPLLLLLGVRRPLAEPDHLPADRAGHRDAALRRDACRSRTPAARGRRCAPRRVGRRRHDGPHRLLRAAARDRRHAAPPAAGARRCSIRSASRTHVYHAATRRRGRGRAARGGRAGHARSASGASLTSPRSLRGDRARRRGRCGATGSTSCTAISGARRWSARSSDGSPACRCVLASKRSLTGDDRAARARVAAYRAPGRHGDRQRRGAARRGRAARHARAAGRSCRTASTSTRFRVAPAGARRAKAALGLDPRRPVVGTVGRLEDRKGHDLLLAALRQLRGSRNGQRPQVLHRRRRAAARRAGARRRATLGIADGVRFTGTLRRRAPGARGDGRLRAAVARRGHVERAARGDGGGAARGRDGRRRQRARWSTDGRTGVLVPPGDAGGDGRARSATLLADPDRARPPRARRRAAFVTRALRRAGPRGRAASGCTRSGSRSGRGGRREPGASSGTAATGACWSSASTPPPSTSSCRGSRPACCRRSRRLIREGVRAPLRSTLPALTPPGWTSAATGRNPGQAQRLQLLPRPRRRPAARARHARRSAQPARVGHRRAARPAELRAAHAAHVSAAGARRA